MEETLLLIIVNHTVELAIVSSIRCTRVFLHLGMKFTSDREDFLVEMYILLRRVLFEPCGRIAKVGIKLNKKSCKTILWAVPDLGPLV